MKYAVFVVGLGVFGMLTLPAHAQVRELERSELRENVRSGKSMSLSRLMDVIGTRVDAEIVDVRAFESNGVFYRVLLKRPNGKLTVAIVDARTGRFMSGRSEVAKSVMAAAKSNNGKGKSQSAAARAKSSGNSNAGGNGGGNSGGNGNSNSGGNGNGNSGGGGGNSGGGGGGGNSGGGGRN